MISKAAAKWADWLVTNGAEPESREIIIYGIECAFNEIIANLIVFAIAFIIKMPLEMLVWQVFWLALRINLGGQHAKSHFACIVCSTLLAVVCVLLIPVIVLFPLLILIEILFSISIAFFVAPSIHPNRLISEGRILKVKKRGRVICIAESVIIFVLYFTFPAWVAHVATLGMFSAAVLCLIGKFTNKEKMALR